MRRRFVLILSLMIIAFFAGYGFGKQGNVSAPQVSGEMAGQQVPDGYGPSHNHSYTTEGHSDDESTANTVEAVWTIENAQAGQATSIRIHIQDGAGSPVDKLDIGHEKLLHLIVVSKDLSYFNHIHPEYKGNGDFVITNTFPSGGDYKLIADFAPADSGKITRAEWIQIDGEPEDAIPLTSTHAHTNIVDGVEVTLMNNQPEAGVSYELHFQLTDAITKEPITDLEPYLGAVGHVVILSEDTENYLHVHPMEDEAKGPDARFMTTFPGKGTYKLWGQFQRNGKVFTAPFVVQVS